MRTRNLLFGIAVTPSADDYPAIVAQVHAADRGALDLVGVLERGDESAVLDSYMLIADLLARTSQVRLFPDASSLAERDPLAIARAAASLDRISRGRFALGLGATAARDEVDDAGNRVAVSRRALEALERDLPLVRAVLADGLGPVPIHGVEIWVRTDGARGLSLAGRLADGWLASLGSMRPDAFRRSAERIDEAAARAGREPSQVRRICTIPGAVSADRRDDRNRAGGRTRLVGSVDRWVDTLAGWTLDLGVDAFVFAPERAGIAEIERFAEEVVPAVRRAVSGAGAGPR